MSNQQVSGAAGGSVSSGAAKFAIAGDRVMKGRLLMAGLGEEIRALWDTFSRVEAWPAPNGHLDLNSDSILDVLNGLRRALTSIRSLDLEVFQNSNEQAYLAVRAADPRGLAVVGLTAPRNNAVHHPEVVDPGVDRAMGPLADGRYFIFPAWVDRTSRLDPMFTTQRGFSQAYADAYDGYVAGRSLLDPLLDAFDFFDSLAPLLARRDIEGQLAHFPLPPPPIAGVNLYFRLLPSSPNETKQRAVLDLQLRFMLETSLPEGRERVITGAFEADGEVVLTGYTVVSDTYRHLFLDVPVQVQADIRGGFRYLLSAAQPSSASEDGAVEVAADLTLPDGRRLPTDALLAAAASDAEVSRGRWELCQRDASYYRRFRRPGG
ncbi:hypothetical protein H5399_09165 [Tessaracoccus sp. MC1627]|uniref:hypothetical protein n=1 Tax=Tessaracoccus sp. MC1627 TaxID=2760312 RepID=UPI0015FFC76D|nr:hypothetical protein [Tessaracoccus sp. MC1627]MBB1512770.1 hypothetical protein [Tessaracoccus sp. MC1627]